MHEGVAIFVVIHASIAKTAKIVDVRVDDPAHDPIAATPETVQVRVEQHSVGGLSTDLLGAGLGAQAELLVLGGLGRLQDGADEGVEGLLAGVGGFQKCPPY